jgi:hypothetical protein
MPPRCPSLVLLCLVSLTGVALTGCEVRTTVSVDVAEDGSGRVEVAVGLDPEALGRLPDLDDDGRSTVDDLAALVRTDDLAATGWQVDGPTTGGDDLTWIRATKAFGTPGEAGRVLAEITGPDGPLRDLRVARETSFGRTRLTFEGTADLSGGLEAFGDEGLAAALEGEVLGQDAAAIEQELGRPLADVFLLEITADLPGDVSSNGTRQSSGGPVGAAWSPELGGEPVRMDASGTVRDWPVLVLSAAAVLCALALLALLVTRMVRPRLQTRL